MHFDVHAENLAEERHQAIVRWAASVTPGHRAAMCHITAIRAVLVLLGGQCYFCTYGGEMVSAVRRLLDEISWEGNARKYRQGGIGLENVLTTEVFQALDFLPRRAFLGSVLAGASGAPMTAAQADIERVTVDLLPGDLTHPDLELRAQPDALIDSAEAFVFVEAKRRRRSSFQADQLAKELLLAAEHGRGRNPVLLLVLNAPPPIRVQGHGTLTIEEALLLGQELISARHGRQVDLPPTPDSVAWTTWADIGTAVAAAAQDFDESDESTLNAVARIAMTVTEALRVHA